MVAECLDTDLPQDQARVASELMGQGAGEERGAPAGQPSDSGADQFSYTLDLTRGASSRTFSWSERDVPERARPLLATLGGMSKPSRGR